MNESFYKSVTEFVDSRIESVLISDEYELYNQIMYSKLEKDLYLYTNELDETAKHKLIEILYQNISSQMNETTREVYRQAVRDSFSFLINTLIIPKQD